MACEYCKDYTMKVKSMHEEHKESLNSWFSLYEHYMEVVIFDEVDTFRINYCPMCGIKLS